MDMFMKNLKMLVHTTHSELKNTIPQIKKSHLYEAIASFCGFKSYAAFQLAGVQQIVSTDQASRDCFDRMLKIGFDADDALLISRSSEQLSEELNNIDLDDVWYFYNNASYEEKLLSPSMLAALKLLVAEGNLEARLIGLVLVTEVLTEFEEEPDNRSGEYWQNKRLAGNSLNDLQKEVADNYLQIQCYRELLEFICSEALNSVPALFPSPSKLKKFSNKFTKVTNKEWTAYFSEAPYLVMDAFEYMERISDSNNTLILKDLFLDWYRAEALLSPSKEIIANIIENIASNEEKWLWHYLGLSHDFDVTEDAHIAINSDTGEEYDGYGPAMVGGYTGVSMPEISEPSKLEMQKLVTSLFSKSIK
jgi:hypothetical protein